MIRREMDRVRGGCSSAGDGEGRVPLEFDEQNEILGQGIPAGEGEGDGENMWHAWSKRQSRYTIQKQWNFQILDITHFL